MSQGQSKSSHLLAAEMKEQQELYSWLRIEYAELFKQQEELKLKEKEKNANSKAVAAMKQLQNEYQTRFAAYQVKLAKYHECQKLILASSAASSSSSSSSSQKEQHRSGSRQKGMKAKTSPNAVTNTESEKLEKNLSNDSNVNSVLKTVVGGSQLCQQNPNLLKN